MASFLSSQLLFLLSDVSLLISQHLVSKTSEKAMATHSCVLAWRIPGMAKPGGLSSMGSHRVGHD